MLRGRLVTLLCLLPMATLSHPLSAEQISVHLSSILASSTSINGTATDATQYDELQSLELLSSPTDIDQHFSALAADLFELQQMGQYDETDIAKITTTREVIDTDINEFQGVAANNVVDDPSDSRSIEDITAEDVAAKDISSRI